MKRQGFFWCLLVFVLPFTACNQNDTVGGEWLIPRSEVLSGGPGKDGIPSVDNPQFASVDETTYLSDNDLVIGIKVGDEVRAYSHRVLDWHEIVNDILDTVAVALTYCPLTGTGVGWDRKVNGTTTTFGVSGLLYNSNLIPYDRATDSEWSQIRLDCVHGELMETEIRTLPIVETTWKTWKSWFPNSKVITLETGHSRDYTRYPYGSYRSNNNLNFPVDTLDERLHKKERVLGLINRGNGQARVYRFDPFQSGRNTIMDQMGSQDIVVFGSEPENVLVAYQSTLPDGTQLSFHPYQGENSQLVMEDNEGNRWNVFGEAIEGPRAGAQLLPTESFIGYFFSWGSFYRGVEIYE
ncbi:MAG: DUF3179 domain-containing protein [Bacteroidota bacterium]